MLRHIVISSVALAALSTASFAADLPNRKAPPPIFTAPAPVFSWTGFYVGAQVGWTHNNDRASAIIPGIPARPGIAAIPGPFAGSAVLNDDGIVGGVHAGYNWQMANWVFGLEGDIEALDYKKSYGGPVSFSDKASWQGSIRPRIGYALANNILLYGTGGVAFRDFKNSYTDVFFPGGPFFYSHSSTRAGWTLGAGVEYAFNNAWSARAEYRYTDYGSHTDGIPLGVGVWSGGAVKHKVNENTIKVGVSYHFGGPASAVFAKY